MNKLLTFVLAAMAFVACTQNDVEEFSANREALPETLTVGFEGGDTRIELNEAVKTVWTEGDEVSVFYKTLTNIRGAFQGKTGDRQGNILLPQTVLGDAVMDEYVVIYPYNEDYLLNTEALTLNAPIPATQSYKEGSYGENGNIMADASDATHVTLRSIYGWLRIHLTGAGEVVESITLRGNNGEQLAGYAQIDLNDYSVRFISESSEPENDMEVGGDLVFEDELITEITLDCGEGVELGAEERVFYIALLPQTFEKGVTIEVNCADCMPMTLSTDSGITIERNHIKPMTSVEYEPDSEPTTTASQIWYTATALVEPNTSSFNVAIVSNEWDETTGEGVITFDGELTEIGDWAFYWSESLSSIDIPESVQDIGKYVFYGCHSLKSIRGPYASDDGLCLVINGKLITFAIGCGATQYTIPDNVTIIWEDAFDYCSSLEYVTLPEGVTDIRKDAFSSCSSLKSINIPNSVSYISNCVFAYCDSLEKFEGKFASADGRCLIIDGTLNSFAAAGIDNYVIPDGVTTIGNEAFAYRDRPYSVTIPGSITSIESGAFYHCYNLEKVYCQSTIPPTMSDLVFESNGTDRKIYVPAESVEAYKAAEGWSEYADYIVGYDFETGEEDALPDDVVMNVVSVSAKMRTGGKVWDLILNENTEILGEVPTQITVGMGTANAQYLVSDTYATPVSRGKGIYPGTINTSTGEWTNSVYRYSSSLKEAIEDCELTIAIDEATQTAAISGHFISQQTDYETDRTVDVNVIFEWNGPVEGFRWEDPTAEITNWKTFAIDSSFDDCKVIRGESAGGNEVVMYLHTLGATKDDALAAGTYPVADWVYTTTSNYCENQSTEVNGYAITSGSVTVEGGGDNYTVRYELSDGTYTYKGVYTGAL